MLLFKKVRGKIDCRYVCMHIKTRSTGKVGGSNLVYLTSHCVIIVHAENQKD